MNLPSFINLAIFLKNKVFQKHFSSQTAAAGGPFISQLFIIFISELSLLSKGECQRPENTLKNKVVFGDVVPYLREQWFTQGMVGALHKITLVWVLYQLS